MYLWVAKVYNICNNRKCYPRKREFYVRQKLKLHWSP